MNNLIIDMINSYFRSTAVRPSSSQTQFSNVSSYGLSKYMDRYGSKYRKHKLIIILLARASHRVLKSYWDVLWEQDRRTSELLGRMLTLCDKNVAYSLFFGLEQIKQKAAQNRTN